MSAPQDTPPPRSLVNAITQRPLRALIVEDDPQVVRTLSRWLRLRNVQIALAVRMADLDHIGMDFDFGIFDIDLPETDGVQLARYCLDRGIVRRAVFFSGSRDTQLRTMAQGIGEFVEKGSGIDVLTERVLSAYRPSSLLTRSLAVG